MKYHIKMTDGTTFTFPKETVDIAALLESTAGVKPDGWYQWYKKDDPSKTIEGAIKLSQIVWIRLGE